MSRRSKRAAPAPSPAPTVEAPRWAYAVAILLPFVVLLLVEVTLRLTWKSARLPLFVPAAVERPGYLVANRDVARRWFMTEQSPPVPIPEPFAATKPPHAFRIFVLGESTTAGFPYPHNGTFTRLLRDALRDVLPDDSVEVVNLGIPATNSYAMLDMADEVIAQHPDAVLIYAGHNEYYGALGVASREGALYASPPLVHTYLTLQRIRLVYALRQGITWLRRRATGGTPLDQAPSFMETLALDQEVPLDGSVYRRGERQFEANLEALRQRFASAKVPLFIGSLASDLRGQPPLAAQANAQRGGADSVYQRAVALLASGDTAGARTAFIRARDLDVVRFRAPSTFNDIIRRIAKEPGATYVPVVEAFDSASDAGIPGHDLFLEHVHPNEHGTAVLARAYFDALQKAGFLGRSAQLARLRPWSAYVAGMSLTPFDERVAAHTVNTLMLRWPFVPVSAEKDYRGTYRPAGVLDSLSFLVSRGAAWAPAKLELAKWYGATGHPDSALAELRGLARDTPLFAEPWELVGQTALAAGDTAQAIDAFRRALAIQPSGPLALMAATLAIRRKDVADAIPLFHLALALEPMRPDIVYELSLAYGMAHELDSARATAVRLARVAPGYPGLADWLRTLGMMR